MIEDFVRIRSAQVEDAPALSVIHHDAWLLAYRGIIPDLQLRATLANHDTAWWERRVRMAGDNILVLMAGPDVAGYCVLGRARGQHPMPTGEIYELYVGPDHQGLGFGATLFEAARAALDRQQLTRLIVWALTDNDSACTFYTGRGGRPAGEALEAFGAVLLHRTAYVWA